VNDAAPDPSYRDAEQHSMAASLLQISPSQPPRHPALCQEPWGRGV